MEEEPFRIDQKEPLFSFFLLYFLILLCKKWQRNHCCGYCVLSVFLAFVLSTFFIYFSRFVGDLVKSSSRDCGTHRIFASITITPRLVCVFAGMPNHIVSHLTIVKATGEIGHEQVFLGICFYGCSTCMFGDCLFGVDGPWYHAMSIEMTFVKFDSWKCHNLYKSMAQTEFHTNADRRKF